MTKVAILQARMSSSRLPGKVLKKVLNRPLLSFQLERINQSKLVDEIVIATTINRIDDAIESVAESEKIKLFRGSEEDVLGRFNGAAEEFDAKLIVRLTADCPLIDPDIIDEVIGRFGEQSIDCQFATNAIPRSYPAGLEVECFTREALGIAAAEAIDSYDREHVTSFFYRNPKRFKPLSVVSKVDHSKERWTLDEPQDFLLIKKVIEGFSKTNKAFRMHDIISILDVNPDWRELNSMIVETPRLVKNSIFKGDET